MARIVAGTAGGRAIAVPAAGTRPTTDRVREALFSALDHRDAVAGARVLDLYAGSGALGLEAASRGAASVVLVEADRRAAAVCRANAADLGLGGVVSVRQARVEQFLRRTPATRYDLVLADPPYDLRIDEVLRTLAVGWVAPGGVVVLERSGRGEPPTWPEGFAPQDVRRYGETAIHIATCAG